MDQHATWYGLRPGDIVLDGDPDPLKKAHSSATFRHMSIVAKRLDGSICYLVRTTKVDLGLVDIVLDGDPALPSKWAQQPLLYSTHVYCGQTAGWIEMPLGT